MVRTSLVRCAPLGVAAATLAFAGGLTSLALAATAQGLPVPIDAKSDLAPPASSLVLAQAAPAAVMTSSPVAARDALKGDNTRTRFVIALEKHAEFQVFSLTAPNRVIVEMPDVKMQLPAHAGDKPIGLVRSFRGGLSAPGRSRVVIDVTQPVVVESAGIATSKDGRSHRLVLEIVPVDTAGRLPPQARRPLKSNAQVAALGASNVQPPMPRPAERPKQKADKAWKPLIVIDPGHGGHDSGASKWGTVEKDVVLAFSKVLRDKLVATGRYKVMLTRNDDSFIDLDQRREFAEKHKATLFIAVHADYAGGKARGATIYSLKESVANDLKHSAKGEVSENVLSAKEAAATKQAGGNVDEVKSMLADLAQREVNITKERTNGFTRSVIDYMGATTSMQHNPDRSAVFRVLKTAMVPAVLIELAYVSNQQDAHNLKSDQWRDKVSDSIMTAVDNYVSNQVARLPM